jgi:hypothetical protein
MDRKNLIEKHISKNIKKYYPNTNFNSFEITLNRYKRALITTPYSDSQFLAKIYLNQKNKSIKKYIFIKQHKNAEKEYKNYKKIEEFTTSTKKLIPKYYDFIKDKNIVLSEYIYPSKNLLYDFLRYNIPRANKEKSSKLILKIASWLSNFQNSLRLEKNRDINYFIDKAEKNLSKLPFFSINQKKDLVNYLKKQSTNFKKLPQVYSNDLCLRHILISNNELCVCDWDDLKTTFPYYDIHSLFINLESRTRHPFIFSQEFIENLETTFLNKYKQLSNFKFSTKEFNITRRLYLIDFLYNRYTWWYKDNVSFLKKNFFWQSYIRKIEKELIYIKND